VDDARHLYCDIHPLPYTGVGIQQLVVLMESRCNIIGRQKPEGGVDEDEVMR
jgi:hypothetical protein